MPVADTRFHREVVGPCLRDSSTSQVAPPITVALPTAPTPAVMISGPPGNVGASRAVAVVVSARSFAAH